MAGGISPGTGISAVAVNLASPGPIGGTTPAAGTFTTLTSSAAAITGGTIDGTVIGGTTPAATTGTTITANTQFVGTLFRQTAGSASSQLSLGSDITLQTLNASRALILKGDQSFVGSSSGATTFTINGTLGWTTTAVAQGVIPDLQLARDAANTLALKNGNNAQAFNHYAGNGGCHGLVSFNESLTIAAAATTDSATTIPAGAQIVAVSVRVTTVIPTAATFTVTAATGGTTFNTAAVTVAAGSTDAGTAAGGATYTSAGTKIRITPNLTPGAATGVVRICGYYRLITPPTS